jgi:LemA protein
LRKTTIVIVVGVILLAVWGAKSYNSLVKLDQAVNAQWAQVENAYQRRLDLIPNLVETVKGAAAHERDTLTQITEARARIGQLTAGKDLVNDKQAFEAFQQAQDQLSSALGRLIAVSEAYPDLKAVEAFRDLLVQLEGTENRISVERMRFNEVAQAYNERRRSFPAVLVAGFLGFEERPYFKATAGAERSPQVRF